MSPSTATTRYAALFRGINVGKAKRVAMADLKATLIKLKFKDVSTLLNSGNAAFSAPTESTGKLAAKIRAAVLKHCGVDAAVIVKSAEDIANVIQGNTVRQADDASRLLCVLVDDSKTLAAMKPLVAQDWGVDAVLVGKHAAYVWCSGGILESKALVAVMKLLQGGGTTRNWATMQKINALLGGEA